MKVIVTSITMFLLCVFLPLVQIEKVDTILTPATFLYGVIYGFQISLVLGNFFQLKTLLSSESGGILAIVHLANIIGGDFAREIEERVEKYILTAIDYPVTNYVQQTTKEFFAIFEPLTNLKPEGENQTAAMNYIHEGLYYLPQIRNQIQQLAPRDIEPTEWILLITLAAFLIVDLILGRQADILSKISAAIFATTVISSLFLLDELDSNRVQKARLDYGIFNDTLTAMNKLPYYPEFAIKNGFVKTRNMRHYRIGKFAHYPLLFPKEIREVDG